MNGKRYRVAFSFAGEKRDFVAKVAAILAKHFGTDAILYDEFHAAAFARSDLGTHLPPLYAESDLVVAVMCLAYPTKFWVSLEWPQIVSLLATDAKRVMLSRFDGVKPQGLTDIAGYIELDEMTPEQFATLILERLATNEAKPKDYYTTRTSIPNNLPRLQPFFGRENQLKTIAEALDPNKLTWGVLIDGPGGIGKTSLAIRAAYDCPPIQFKRIVFVSVKEYELDDEGVRFLGSFSGVLKIFNELASELGQPEIAKAPQDQRVPLLLDALRPAQALLILDNLESLSKTNRDEVLTFVKNLPGGCKAILTSRHRFGNCSEELMLEELSQTAALQTLADLAGHNALLARTSEAERLALYTHTSGNPLLLRWIAGQLGRGSCRTIEDALAFIRACPPNNDPLEFIFGDLVNETTPLETSVISALVYFKLPAKVEHVAQICEVEDVLAGRALNSLANRPLVADRAGRAFVLVPMVADFLRRQKPEVIAAAGDALEKLAYALAVENGYDKHDRFLVLDAAWPAVSAALPRFLAGPNDRLQTVCDALEKFLDFTVRWDERVALNRQAERKAIENGDHHSACRRAYQAGWIHYLRKQVDQVHECANRAASHCEHEQTGPKDRCLEIRLRAFVHELTNDYAAAATAYHQVLDIERGLAPESPDVASALNDIATIEYLARHLDRSDQFLREALSLARKTKDAEGTTIYVGNLADLALAREDWLGAEASAGEALASSEKIGRWELVAGNLLRIAKAFARRGRNSEAVSHARRAVDILTELRAPGLIEAREILAECET